MDRIQNSVMIERLLVLVPDLRFRPVAPASSCGPGPSTSFSGLPLASAMTARASSAMRATSSATAFFIRALAGRAQDQPVVVARHHVLADQHQTVLQVVILIARDTLIPGAPGVTIA